jgi:hypothetical protein
MARFPSALQQLGFATCLALLSVLASPCRAQTFTDDFAEEQAIAPGKFIPTFAVKYGGTMGWPPAEEAARFDLIDVSAGTAHARVHASARGNTWQTLKSLNPNIKLFLYKNGPGLYNTSSWGQLGQGWDWLTENHGMNTKSARCESSRMSVP